MVAYATVEQVEQHNAQRQLYSGSTRPSRPQVEAFLADGAAEINAILSAQGLATPVTTPADFLAYVTRLNALYAAALAEQAAFPEADGDLGGSGSGARYWRMWESGKRDLISGASIPPAAGTAGARVRAATYGTDNRDSSGDVPAPAFSMTRQF